MCSMAVEAISMSYLLQKLPSRAEMWTMSLSHEAMTMARAPRLATPEDNVLYRLSPPINDPADSLRTREVGHQNLPTFLQHASPLSAPKILISAVAALNAKGVAASARKIKALWPRRPLVAAGTARRKPDPLRSQQQG